AFGVMPRAPRITWSQFHFDSAHTGNNPSETILSSATVPSLHQLWASRAQLRPIESSPAVSDSRVYFTYSTFPTAGMTSLDARNGHPVWSGMGMDSSPALWQGLAIDGGSQ